RSASLGSADCPGADAIHCPRQPSARSVLRYRRYRRCNKKTKRHSIARQGGVRKPLFSWCYIRQKKRKFQFGQDAPSVPHRLDISSCSRGETQPAVGTAKPLNGSFERFSSPPLASKYA